MKTKSLWGFPPSRFYRFLKRVEDSFESKSLNICILGCSDGKFVLPAARKGHKVLAIDIDTIAIFGGEKVGPEGKVFMEGLMSRLKKEELSPFVKVANSDFMEYQFRGTFHAVFTSGAINYSYNLKHRIETIIEKIKFLVRFNGFLYFDYMLPFEEIHNTRKNYFKKGELVNYFNDGNWAIIYDKVIPPLLEKAHVDNPHDHYHHWGHMCLKRINEDEL